VKWPLVVLAVVVVWWVSKMMNDLLAIFGQVVCRRAARREQNTVSFFPCFQRSISNDGRIVLLPG
jgi:hypothetical protein